MLRPTLLASAVRRCRLRSRPACSQQRLSSQCRLPLLASPAALQCAPPARGFSGKGRQGDGSDSSHTGAAASSSSASVSSGSAGSYSSASPAAWDAQSFLDGLNDPGMQAAFENTEFLQRSLGESAGMLSHLASEPFVREMLKTIPPELIEFFAQMEPEMMAELFASPQVQQQLKQLPADVRAAIDQFTANPKLIAAILKSPGLKPLLRGLVEAKHAAAHNKTALPIHIEFALREPALQREFAALLTESATAEHKRMWTDSVTRMGGIPAFYASLQKSSAAVAAELAKPTEQFLASKMDDMPVAMREQMSDPKILQDIIECEPITLGIMRAIDAKLKKK